MLGWVDSGVFQDRDLKVRSECEMIGGDTTIRLLHVSPGDLWFLWSSASRTATGDGEPVVGLRVVVGGGDAVPGRYDH